MNQKPVPPSWAPNAIATSRGWVNPKTGELLVAKSNLLSYLKDNDTATQPKMQAIFIEKIEKTEKKLEESDSPNVIENKEENQSEPKLINRRRRKTSVL